MKQEEDGNKTFFFDTYALFAIVLGQESYKEYTTKIEVVTTIMNIYELYYILIQQNKYREAEIFFEKFLPNCIDVEPPLIKEASKFRLQNSKLKLSYVDALGYVIARELGISFLTGDNGFKDLPNVKFIK